MPPSCRPPGILGLASGMITITGAGDHDPPDWLITMTGIRRLRKNTRRGAEATDHSSLNSKLRAEVATGDGTPSVRAMPEVGRMAPFKMILSNAG
jgi:hypothetical protein